MKKWLLALVVVLALLSPGCASLVPSIVTFDVTPSTITTGQQAMLTWNVSGASSVSIDQLGVVASFGAQGVMPPTTTVYTIRATNFVGTVTRSVVLTVNPQPVTIIFELNPATITSGGYAALVWNVSGATSISIDHGIGPVPLTGNKMINPAATTMYTLTASNLGGTASRSVTLVVNPTVVATFTANPSTIFPGQATTLQWNVTGATSVTIDNRVGDVQATGSQLMYPYTTTTYTLSASSDCCSVSKSVIVTVARPYPIPYDFPYAPFIEVFEVSPATIHTGQSATISWYVVGARSIYISGIGYVSYSGSIAVSPTSTTMYVIQATDAYVTRERTITVVVIP